MKTILAKSSKQMKEDGLKALADGESAICFDFTNIGAVDSSMLGVLVMLNGKTPDDTIIVLDGISSELYTLLDLTHLDVMFFIRKEGKEKFGLSHVRSSVLRLID